MPDTPLKQLSAHGQSVWIDFLSRPFVQRRRARGARRATASSASPRTRRSSRARSPRATPTTSSCARCSRPRPSRRRSSSRSPSRTSRPPATSCGPIWDEAGENARDGWVSLEVDPNLAHDTQGTIDEAKRLQRARRPAEPVREDPGHEGGPAGDRGVDRGRHPDQRHADLLARAPPRGRRGLRARRPALRRRRRRPRRGWPRSPRSSSRASTPRPTSGSTRSAATTSSRARSRSPTRSSPTRPTRSSSPASSGRRCAPRARAAQRCLWASTSTKNPEYRDVIYVEELIGPDTVNTMPRETVEAFQDHGEVRESLTRGRRRRAPHARRVRRGRHRLRRRRRDARARGRREVRQVVPAAVRRRRGQARRRWWRHERTTERFARARPAAAGRLRPQSARRPAPATRRRRCRPPT